MSTTILLAESRVSNDFILCCCIISVGENRASSRTVPWRRKSNLHNDSEPSTVPEAGWSTGIWYLPNCESNAGRWCVRRLPISTQDCPEERVNLIIKLRQGQQCPLLVIFSRACHAQDLVEQGNCLCLLVLVFHIVGGQQSNRSQNVDVMSLLSVKHLRLLQVRTNSRVNARQFCQRPQMSLLRLSLAQDDSNTEF